MPVQIYLGISFLAVAAAARFALLKLRAGQRALMTFIAMAVVYLAFSPRAATRRRFLQADVPA